MPGKYLYGQVTTTHFQLLETCSFCNIVLLRFLIDPLFFSRSCNTGYVASCSRRRSPHER